MTADASINMRCSLHLDVHHHDFHLGKPADYVSLKPLLELNFLAILVAINSDIIQGAITTLLKSNECTTGARSTSEILE